MKKLGNFLENSLQIAKNEHKTKQEQKELKAIIKAFKQDCAPILQVNYHSPPTMDKYSLVTNI